MKALISVLLSASLLLEGCFSFYAVNKEDARQLRDFDNQRIQVVLTNGITIESPAFQHRLVSEPSHFVLGTGTATRRGSSRSDEFVGILDSAQIDSSKVLPFTEGRLFRCWRLDSTEVTFRPGMYAVITPEMGTGYCVGIREGDRIIPMMIDPRTIQEVKVQYVDIIITVPALVGVAFIVGVMIFSAEWNS